MRKEMDLEAVYTLSQLFSAVVHTPLHDKWTRTPEYTQSKQNL